LSVLRLALALALAVACWALFAAPAHAGSNYVPIRIELLSAPEIFVQAGELHPEPPRFRVTHADSGLPVAGMTFFVHVNVWYCIVPFQCPDWDISQFGTFEGASLNEPRDLVLAPDADGVVTALPLRGGIGNNAYTIGISPVDLRSPWALVVGSRPEVRVNQVATTSTAARTVPSLSFAGLALLGVLVLATARRR
jgi:hypothetical protein